MSESVHCERVRNSCRRTRQREGERVCVRERERERDSKCVAHSHTHTPKRPFTHGHTLHCPRSIPSSSCVSIASFSCTTTSLQQDLAQVHLPTYLALPSLPRGPSCHIRWCLPSSAPRTFTPHTPAAHLVTSDGLSPLQPHIPLPPVPPRPPRDQQGNLVLQPGDCCLLILQPCASNGGEVDL